MSSAPSGYVDYRAMGMSTTVPWVCRLPCHGYVDCCAMDTSTFVPGYVDFRTRVRRLPYLGTSTAVPGYVPIEYPLGASR